VGRICETSKRACERERRSFTARDHPEGIKMSHTKFAIDPLKTVAEHKKQRNRQTDRFSFIKVKVKVGVSYSAAYSMTGPARFLCNLGSGS